LTNGTGELGFGNLNVYYEIPACTITNATFIVLLLFIPRKFVLSLISRK
jgi:hypothetical protein